MPTEEIQARIPHRPPMLLVDEVREQSAKRIVCRKTFRAEEFFFQGHYPDYPLVPGVILCESAMQAGALLLADHLQGQNRVPVATRIDEVKFKRMVRPGETIEMIVELDEQLAGAFFMTARVTCEAKVVLRFRFACTAVAEAAGPA